MLKEFRAILTIPAPSSVYAPQWAMQILFHYLLQKLRKILLCLKSFQSAWKTFQTIREVQRGRKQRRRNGVRDKNDHRLRWLCKLICGKLFAWNNVYLCCLFFSWLFSTRQKSSSHHITIEVGVERWTLWSYIEERKNKRKSETVRVPMKDKEKGNNFQLHWEICDLLCT